MRVDPSTYTAAFGPSIVPFVVVWAGLNIAFDSRQPGICHNAYQFIVSIVNPPLTFSRRGNPVAGLVGSKGIQSFRLARDARLPLDTKTQISDARDAPREAPATAA